MKQRDVILMLGFLLGSSVIGFSYAQEPHSRDCGTARDSEDWN